MEVFQQHNVFDQCVKTKFKTDIEFNVIIYSAIQLQLPPSHSTDMASNQKYFGFTIKNLFKQNISPLKPMLQINR